MVAPLQQQPSETQVDAARRILGHSHKKKFAKRSKGATVRAMQIFLASKGYNVGGFDGDWGDKTEAAFQEYLTDKGASSRNASKQILNDMSAELMPLPNLRPENAPVDPMAPDQIPMPPMRPEPPLAMDAEIERPMPMGDFAAGPAPMPEPMPAGPHMMPDGTMMPGAAPEPPAAAMPPMPPQERPMGMDDPDQNLGPGDQMFNPMLDAQAMAARSNTVRSFEEPWDGMSGQDQEFFDAGEGAREAKERQRQALAEEEAERLLTEANSPMAAGLDEMPPEGEGGQPMMRGAQPANPMRDALINPGQAPQFQPQPPPGMNPAMDRLREALMSGMVPPGMMAGR